MKSNRETYQATFTCTECNRGKYPLDEIVYTCKKCGGLLEVSHNLEALKQRPAEEWKALFDSRWGRLDHPYPSGVWNKKELVLPHIDNLEVVSLGEGRSPLVPHPYLAQKLSLKHLFIKQVRYHPHRLF